MTVEPEADCPPHCCCCTGEGDACCDCGEVPVRSSEVLAFVDYFAGQEDTAEDVRDFVQLAARFVSEGKARKDFRAHGVPLEGFVDWCEEEQAKRAAA